MAIKKRIRKDNGLELEYHRIAMLKIDTNQQITLLLHSYLNEEGRNYEKAYARGDIEGAPLMPYVNAEYLTFDYDEAMNIKKAYEVLKGLPQFDGAVDI